MATGFGRSVSLWDAATGRQRKVLPVDVEVRRLAWSPDGQHLVTPGLAQNRFVYLVWDRATWTQHAVLPTSGSSYPSLAWSPTWALLAVTADDRLVTLWDTETGKPRCTLTLRTASPREAAGWSDARAALLAWRPDGKLLATVSPQHGFVKVWSHTGELRAILTGPGEGASCLQWSLDGKILACSYQDHTTILWDPATRRRRAVLRGHTGPITDLGWSRDGRMLATSSEDGSLRLWSAATGKELVAFYSPNEGKEWLAVTPGGYFAASAHGADCFRWREGTKLWPVAKFRRFERPDLVRRALVGRGVQ